LVNKMKKDNRVLTVVLTIIVIYLASAGVRWLVNNNRTSPADPNYGMSASEQRDSFMSGCKDENLETAFGSVKFQAYCDCIWNKLTDKYGAGNVGANLSKLMVNSEATPEYVSLCEACVTETGMGE